MGVYVDIDADFMFRPRTSGNPRIRQERWIEPAEVVNRLADAGLDWGASPVEVFTDHKEAYFVWRERGVHSATLVHVDAHFDFYDTFPWLVHCGNFLRKAAEERLFSKIVWVVPRWLYDSREWRSWDMEGVYLGRRRPECSYHETGHWRRRGGQEVDVEVVAHDRFVMPNSRAALVTVATSPMFVPSDALTHVKELVKQVAAHGRRLVVRPHIPVSIEDPVLRRLWMNLRGEMEARRRSREAGETGAGAERRPLSYLWVEHEVLRRHRYEVRGPGVGAAGSPGGSAPATAGEEACKARRCRAS